MFSLNNCINYFRILNTKSLNKQITINNRTELLRMTKAVFFLTSRIVDITFNF